MNPRPITKIVVNGKELNYLTDWLTLDNVQCYALELYLAGAYPTYLRNEVEKRYGKQQNIFIVPSNHNRFKKSRIENPEWFESLSDVRRIKLKKLNENK